MLWGPNKRCVECRGALIRTMQVRSSICWNVCGCYYLRCTKPRIWCHDIHRKDSRQNDIKPNAKQQDLAQAVTAKLNKSTHHFAECRSAECRHVQCCGTKNKHLENDNLTSFKAFNLERALSCKSSAFVI